MTRFCPAYPKPLKNRASLLTMFFRKRRSWMEALFERSYSMKMGEVKLPGHTLYMINQPSLVKQVMVSEYRDFPKHELLEEALKPLLGESIFTTNGETWERQRRMMNPSFELARMELAFPRMQAATDALLQRLDSLGEQFTQDIDVEMTHVTADIIFRTILSAPMESQDAHRIFAAFSRFQALAPKVMLPVVYRLPLWLRSSKTRRECEQAGQEIRGLLEQFIRPRYEAHQRGEGKHHQDVLATLLETVDPVTGSTFDFDELVDQVAMLFLAGHETSASALSWALYLLSRDEEIQQRMHDEVVAILGQRVPDYSDLKHLALTTNVFKEALRLFPPVGFFVRKAKKSCPMRDKSVKAGAMLVIAPWLIHRHRQLWKDPDLFDPDRFEREETRESVRSAYLPFGMGPRLCIGAGFALQEATLILASLVRRYQFTALPGHEPKPVGRFTIRSENGVHLALTRR
jgi:cytochrome P450